MDVHTLDRPAERAGMMLPLPSAPSSAASLTKVEQQEVAAPYRFDLGTSGVRIVMPSFGRSIRTIVGTPRTVGTSGYASARHHVTHSTEAETEELLAWHDEVVVTSVKAWSQPLRVEVPGADRLYRHILDWARQGPSGRWQLIDAKREWRQFRRADGVLASELGRIAADAIGADYVQVVRDAIGSALFIDNLHMVQLYRFARVQIAQEIVAADLLAERGAMALGELADELAAEPARGFATVCALMVRRVVNINLDRPLSRHSAVTGVPPITAPMPGLFDAALAAA